jgi:hypothetical protein
MMLLKNGNVSERLRRYAASDLILMLIQAKRYSLQAIPFYTARQREALSSLAAAY